MMRKRISLLLLFLVLLLAGKEVLWLSSFQLLQRQIADRWCINKYDAELMCGGRCYLYQQLEDWNKAGESPTEFKITRLATVLWYVAPKWTASFGKGHAFRWSRKRQFLYRALLDRLFNITPFIPPESLLDCYT